MARWLLGRAERLLNRWIEESSAACGSIGRLEGQNLRVHVAGLALRFDLRVENGRILIVHDATGTAAVTVSGTPLDLVKLLGPDTARRIHDSGARLTGHIHVAEQFAELMRLARPDLEEELARWVGDIAAYEAGRFARRAGAWLEHAGAALRANTAEYLQEEMRAVPGPYEAQAFYRDVDRLRDDVERSAQRIELLARRMKRHASG